MRSWLGKPRLTDYEREIVENVKQHGCHICAVFDPDENDPSFAYSIGFKKTLELVGYVDAPEVIAFGLPGDVYGPAINELLAMCAGGLKLEDGTRLEQFFGPYDCIARTVHKAKIEEKYLNSAIWFHRTQMGSELQNVMMLVWPDAEHRFPWEPACEEWVSSSQPDLYNPRLNS